MTPVTRVQAKLHDIGVGAYVLYRTDHHLNEIIPPAAECVQWLTGFSGSAGLVIVTLDRIGLFVDGRYTTQAPEQVYDGIHVYPWSWEEITHFLSTHLPKDQKLCIEGNTISAATAASWKDKLPYEITFASGLIDELWDNRPGWPEGEIFELGEEFSGEARANKLKRVQDFIKTEGGDSLILSDMCAIAWLFNIRGTDLGETPVSYAYALISASGNPQLFLRHTHDCGPLVDVLPYETFSEVIANHPKTTLLVDSSETTQTLWEHLHAHHAVTAITNPITLWKAQKNPIEIQGFRDCHLVDAIALCETYAWIEEAHQNGNAFTEISIEDFMNAQRFKQPHNLGLSFQPIVGWKDHGAIIHYHATKATNHSISGDGLLLIDSGGQYKNGTTDVTRTLCLGTPTPEQRNDYTHVLKGVIQLTRASFPVDTSGATLDALARNEVKDAGTNYAHGTGHGVGHCLNVHEGPFHISPRVTNVGIKPGMVLSNEPGIYRTGNYGIRIENLVTVMKDPQSEKDLTFETLTQVPLEPKLIDKELLTQEELQWIDNYHAGIKARLSNKLSPRATQWLLRVCAPI